MHCGLFPGKLSAGLSELVKQLFPQLNVHFGFADPYINFFGAGIKSLCPFFELVALHIQIRQRGTIQQFAILIPKAL